jgi:hypothetical protein
MADTQPDIAVWGPTAAGKTTYLAGLLLALSMFAPEWSMFAGKGDEKAERFMEVTSGDIAEGHFPRPTARERPLMYTFRLWRKDSGLGRTGRYHEIGVIDAAGELILDAEDKTGYFETLRQCRGILCMVDPEISRQRGQPSPADERYQSYFALVNRLFNQLVRDDRLASDGKLDISLAFCLTKMDLDEHWPHRGQPEEYMQDILGAPTFNRILSVCARNKLKFFATSVVGVYKATGGETRPNIEPAGDHSIIADLSQWKPYKVLDPLFWLFDQIERSRDAALPAWRRTLRSALREPNYRG